MCAVISLAGEVGVAAACRALRLPRSALYRERASRSSRELPAPIPAPRRRPPLALSEHEQRVVLEVLNSPRFVNCAPAAIHAQLLDEGRYVASVRTMYRLLQGCSAVREGPTSYAIRSMPSPSFWRSRPTKCGAGISRN